MGNRRWGAFLFWVGCAVACSDDDSGNTVSTGLPADRKLSSLDAASAERACRSLNAGLARVISPDDLLRGQCASLAINENARVRDGQLEVDLAACESDTDACASEPDAFGVPPQPELADCDDEMGDDQFSRCDATVGELEACFNRMLDALASSLSKQSCDNAEAVIRGDDQDFEPASIPECRTLATKCPEVGTVLDDD
ncbi:MAG: hypothetical protein ABW321_09150 [Polyangiales bacterium]